jgi:hypothetical protein
MVQLTVLMARLLLVAQSQASDMADRHALQEFLSKFMPSGSDTSESSMSDYDKLIFPNFKRMRHGSRPDALSHQNDIGAAQDDIQHLNLHRDHGEIAGSTIVDDKPITHLTARVQESKEDQQAEQKLLTHGSNNQISLSAIGIGLVSLATLLGVRLRSRLQPAAVLASSGGLGSGMPMNMASRVGDNFMEMKSQDLNFNYSAATLETSASRQTLPAALVAPAWIRATRHDDTLIVETASRTYVSPKGVKVIVRGIVHVAEDEYWAQIKEIKGRVLFESIVDSAVVDENGALKVALAATGSARKAATSYALTPQLDALGDTARDNDWRVADISKDELGIETVSELLDLPRDIPKNDPMAPNRVAMTIGAIATRLLCLLAPAPELAVVALDWHAEDKSVKAKEAVRAVAAGALALDTSALARLGLARALLAEAPVRTSDDALIGKRNARCIDAIKATTGDAHVLYGVAHLRDLDRRLRKAGYVREQGEAWSRAFAVPLAGETPALVLLALAFLILLFVDGLDYTETIADVASGSAALILALYTIRHTALYYALRKWLLV